MHAETPRLADKNSEDDHPPNTHSDPRPRSLMNFRFR
jgi:hypothetical protein